MKRSVGFFLSVLVCTSLNAQDFDGYIVKLKKGKSLDMKSLSNAREISTSFGQFVKFEGNEASMKHVENFEKKWTPSKFCK